MDPMAEHHPKRYEHRLHACPEALSTVRRIVRGHLDSWGLNDLADSTTLCLTELLANVGKHAGSTECLLTVHHHGDRIRATVSDTARALPVMREPDFLAESGRGLFLIEHTAHAWGTASTPTGKEVWFELHIRPSQPEPNENAPTTVASVAGARRPIS
ncbi:ATP-binding protein [Streptomyces sp. BPTC-684]|uniref:ATP-binding protein n=1 Tax=Streptomyces sp. BPTC-684 TaxID=3043734 RepID=UPI0024B084C8|nr:ATP-binding protein [Streptomyces sp. BPTC-684]WHM36531.1 ATP-binding protein [Streptomyces sp. BPTC-684]